MKNNTRPNLKIIGDNTAGGGYYNDARIVGNSVINGDVDCVSFKSTGDSKINGSLKAENIRTIGSISIAGFIKSSDVVITGNMDSGDVQSETMVIRGGITIDGWMKGNDVKLKGYVTIKKNCETEKFKADGQLTIDGLLNADEVMIKTYGKSRVSEIGGDKITIRKGSNLSVAKMLKLVFMTSGFNSGTMVADSIEGDEIHLDSTKAKIVRGKNVIIDDGCEVELLEYKETVRISGKSSVKEKRKIQ